MLTKIYNGAMLVFQDDEHILIMYISYGKLVVKTLYSAYALQKRDIATVEVSTTSINGERIVNLRFLRAADSTISVYVPDYKIALEFLTFAENFFNN